MFQTKVKKIALAAALVFTLSACNASSEEAGVEGSNAPSESSEISSTGSDDVRNISDASNKDNAETVTELSALEAEEKDAESAEVEEVSCSALGMPLPPSDPSLAIGARETRDAILAAAATCDYEALQKTIDQSPDFISSLAEDPNHIQNWKDLEAAGEDPLRGLVEVLSTSDAVAGVGLDKAYFWPEFQTVGCDEKDRIEQFSDDLEKVGHSVEDYKQLCEDTDNGYYGYRTRIHAGGQWELFVAGE